MVLLVKINVYVNATFCHYFIGHFTILSIIESEVLKSPDIIVELSVTPFNSANVCFTYLETLLFVVVTTSL